LNEILGIFSNAQSMKQIEDGLSHLQVYVLTLINSNYDSCTQATCKNGVC